MGIAADRLDSVVTYELDQVGAAASIDADPLGQWVVRRIETPDGPAIDLLDPGQFPT